MKKNQQLYFQQNTFFRWIQQSTFYSTPNYGGNYTTFSVNIMQSQVVKTNGKERYLEDHPVTTQILWWEQRYFLIPPPLHLHQHKVFKLTTAGDDATRNLCDNGLSVSSSHTTSEEHVRPHLIYQVISDTFAISHIYQISLKFFPIPKACPFHYQFLTFIDLFRISFMFKTVCFYASVSHLLVCSSALFRLISSFLPHSLCRWNQPCFV